LEITIHHILTRQAASIRTSGTPKALDCISKLPGYIALLSQMAKICPKWLANKLEPNAHIAASQTANKRSMEMNSEKLHYQNYSPPNMSTQAVYTIGKSNASRLEILKRPLMKRFT
jgi:hypothetical protein